jgi:hypothetical protein
MDSFRDEPAVDGAALIPRNERLEHVRPTATRCGKPENYSAEESGFRAASNTSS